MWDRLNQTQGAAMLQRRWEFPEFTCTFLSQPIDIVSLVVLNRYQQPNLLILPPPSGDYKSKPCPLKLLSQSVYIWDLDLSENPAAIIKYVLVCMVFNSKRGIQFFLSAEFSPSPIDFCSEISLLLRPFSFSYNHTFADLPNFAPLLFCSSLLHGITSLSSNGTINF